MRNLNRAGLAILAVLSPPPHAALAQKQNLMSGAFVSGSTLYKSCAGSTSAIPLAVVPVLTYRLIERLARQLGRRPISLSALREAKA